MKVELDLIYTLIGKGFALCIPKQENGYAQLIDCMSRFRGNGTYQVRINIPLEWAKAFVIHPDVAINLGLILDEDTPYKPGRITLSLPLSNESDCYRMVQ